MGFLAWLYSELEAGRDGGDCLLGGELACHSSVMRWRQMPNPEHIDSDVLSAIRNWLYLDSLPADIKLDRLLEVCKAAHHLSCNELLKCCTNRISLLTDHNVQIMVEEFVLQNEEMDFLLQVLEMQTPEQICARLLKSEDGVYLNELVQLQREQVFVDTCLAIESIGKLDGEPINLLHQACFYGNVPLVLKLIKNPIWGKQTSLALPYSVSNLDLPDVTKLNCLQILLHHSNNHLLESNVHCALHDATRANSPLCVRELVIQGKGNVSCMKTGMTPVHQAASMGCIESLAVLLEFSTLESITLPDSAFGSTALHLAAQHGREVAVQLILAKFPQCINVMDFHGRTCLHRACGFIVDSLYFDTIHLHRSNNQMMLLNLLLSYGANANQATRNDETIPLMWLVGGGGPTIKSPNPILIDFIPKHVEEEDVLTQCARVLIVHTNLLSTSKDQSTALHIAVRFGFPLIGRELVLAGASIIALDLFGQSPLSLARQFWPRKLVGKMLLLPLPCPPKERRDLSQCDLCSTSFSTLWRRHHCRHCSACVCSTCSKHFIVLNKFNRQHPQRVCEWCYQALQLPSPPENGDVV
ncbi:hypothetical protein BASA81_000731 [Batrachochytrium salamandrivorans]|nr:hypothetical protein BASA81_000731 [Batrachochytrium salamandrivorans]